MPHGGAFRAGDNDRVDSHEPRWSIDVRQADWIAGRLTPWEGEWAITIFVPAGFEAYARVLHPVDTPENGRRLVRWADVAAWSGMPLRKDAQFHTIALPPPAGFGHAHFVVGRQRLLDDHPGPGGDRRRRGVDDEEELHAGVRGRLFLGLGGLTGQRAQLGDAAVQ